MALQNIGSLWVFESRPCVVTGHGTRRIPKKGSWQRDRTWNVNRVMFLDGLAPYSDDIAEKKFSSKSKPIRGAQADYFTRIVELKQQGLMIGAAVGQAKAELAKGIGKSDVLPDGVVDGQLMDFKTV